jgi:hypothetical protein
MAPAVRVKAAGKAKQPVVAPTEKVAAAKAAKAKTDAARRANAKAAKVAAAAGETAE